MRAPDVIYVAKGARGLLKVGRTTRPKARRQSLRKEFRERGDELAHFEECGETRMGHRTENTLIDLFASRLPRHSGREWFSGGLLENAVRAAKETTAYMNRTYRPSDWDLMSKEARAKWSAEAESRRIARRAAESARRKSFVEAESKRVAFCREVKQFRATVCARMADALLAHGTAAAPTPTPEARA